MSQVTCPIPDHIRLQMACEVVYNSMGTCIYMPETLWWSFSVFLFCIQYFFPERILTNSSALRLNEIFIEGYFLVALGQSSRFMNMLKKGHAIMSPQSIVIPFKQSAGTMRVSIGVIWRISPVLSFLKKDKFLLKL